MRTIKLLADENVARQKVVRLRELGFDIVSVAELGLANLRVPDVTVLSIATDQNRIVLTHNGNDFKRLHQKGERHSGILILPDDVRHVPLAEAIGRVLDTETDWTGRIARIQRLPLS